MLFIKRQYSLLYRTSDERFNGDNWNEETVKLEGA